MSKKKYEFRKFWENHWDEVALIVAVILGLLLLLSSQGII
jgi:hypothetical protein